jgi:exonuclease SbcD
MLTFLHAADLHLDSPFVGLERYGDAPADELRGATRRALENLVELAVMEKAAFVLLAGDLYDGGWKDYGTGLFFARQMARLKEAGIRVLLASGNHDASSQITRSLRPPENVLRFPTDRPATFILDDLGVAVHGQGFASRSVEEDLAAGYPPSRAGLLNIGLLHTSLDGRPGHAPYAPCSVDELRSRGYAYWALGHVHAREVVCSDPWIVFPGNPQGRHAREPGAKGCTLVTVEDEEVVEVRERHLDVLRWCTCRIDLAAASSVDEALEYAGRALEKVAAGAEGRLLAVRLELHGATTAHAALRAHPEKWEQELRSLALDRCAGRAWIEKVLLATRPRSGGPGRADRAGSEALAGLLASLQAAIEDPGRLEALGRGLEELRQKLPADLWDPEAAEPQDPTAPVTLRAAVEQARELLHSRLSMARG